MAGCTVFLTPMQMLNILPFGLPIRSDFNSFKLSLVLKPKSSDFKRETALKRIYSLQIYYFSFMCMIVNKNRVDLRAIDFWQL